MNSQRKNQKVTNFVLTLLIIQKQEYVFSKRFIYRSHLEDERSIFVKREVSSTIGKYDGRLKDDEV